MSILLLFVGSTGEPTSGPATGAGYRGLLALYDDTAGGTPAPRPAVGFPSGGRGRRRITRSELEQALKEQRDNTFSRRWFDEFQEAKRAAAVAADETAKKSARKALERAAQAAQRVDAELEASEAAVDLRPITLALEAASGASRLKDTIEASAHAVWLAGEIIAALRAAEEEDEDEAMALLMLS